MSKQKNDDLEVAKRTREYINFFINEYKKCEHKNIDKKENL